MKKTFIVEIAVLTMFGAVCRSRPPLNLPRFTIKCSDQPWDGHSFVFLDLKDGSVFGPKKGGHSDLVHAEFHYHYLMDDNEIPLAALIREGGDNCDYVYGLGDRWYHKITVEQVEIEGVDDKSKGVVVLLGGTGVCPPEDSNGLESERTSAFAEFLADRHEISEKAARPASRS